MNKIYFDLTSDEQRNLLKVAEGKLGLSNTIIEKDLWLCWLLQELFALPLKMAFKGGTSLSKVFGLIHRFSEDVDITKDIIEKSSEGQIPSDWSTGSDCLNLATGDKINDGNDITI